MIDEKLYCETFSRLQASGEAKKEVLLKMNEMKEKKTMRRPFKAMRAVALAAVLTLALAVTANAASEGALLEGMFQTFAITFTTSKGGETFTVNVTDNVPDSILEGLVSPEHGAAVTEKRDGRLFLIIGGEETDITDALNESGEYTAVLDGEETVTVSGTVENHMILTSAKDSDMYYITTKGDVDALNGTNVDMSGVEDVTVSCESMEAAAAQAD